jgi:phage/plasmid-like protein (TIGR03299 family)
MAASDTTIIGYGGSNFASDKTSGAIPLSKVEEMLDFDVHFTKLYVPGGTSVVEVPGKRAVVHGNTGEVLNVVGSGYSIHQYRDVLLDNVSALLDTGKGDLEIFGAGLLDNGGVAWVQMSAPQGVSFSGQEEVAPTLTVATSHNGKYATSYRTGLFRFSCSNQLGGAMRRKQSKVYRLRHTKRSELRLVDARAALGVMWENAGLAVNDMKVLQQAAVSDRQFIELIEQVMPRPKQKMTGDVIDNAGSITLWEAKRDGIQDLWANDPRVNDWRGTAWGAVQAFSTYRQHVAAFRGGSSGSISRDGRNMAALLTGHTDRNDRMVAHRALELVSA